MHVFGQNSVLKCLEVKSNCCLFQSGTEGLAWNTHGSHSLLTLPIRPLGVNDPCLDSTSGITVVMAMEQQVSFCFFCDVHFWCQEHCFNILRDILD